MHWQGRLQRLHEPAAACQEEAAGLALTRVASSAPPCRVGRKGQGRLINLDGGHRA